MNPLALLSAALLAAQPTSWLLWTQQDADEPVAEVVAGTQSSRRILAEIPVAPGYEPRVRLAADGLALVAVSLENPPDQEHGAALWKLRPSRGPAERVATGLAYQPPLALPKGAMAFVETFALHPAPPEAMRRGELDRLTCAVKLLSDSGPVRLLAVFRGYGIHLAGQVSQGIVVYRVARDEAAFYFVSIDGSAQPKRLAAAPRGPFARDFSVRGEELVFASGSADLSGFSVWSLATRSGALRSLFELGDAAPSPLANKHDLLLVRSGGLGRELLSLGGSNDRALVSSRGDLYPWRPTRPDAT